MTGLLPVADTTNRFKGSGSAIIGMERQHGYGLAAAPTKLMKEDGAAMKSKVIFASLIAVFCLAALSAFADDNVKGMIKTRTGETLIVTSGGRDVTVVLTDDTTTKDDKDLFGLDKQRMSNVVLIPGLKVDIEGKSDDQGRFVAKTITVDGDDLEASEMIQAGLHPTAEQVATNVQAIAANKENIAANQQGIATNQANIEANRQEISAHAQRLQESQKDIEEHTQRFMALSDFDVKGEAKLKFGVGSTTISKQDQEELKKLAETAKGLKGYIVEVMGYTDATGNAAMNTKLSEDRAKAVITYLIQQCQVPMRHIVAPGAMGEYASAATNETKAGRAENRRVEVKVLVNKGIAGS
jgi:OmpA-OmpF porin, OOP family